VEKLSPRTQAGEQEILRQVLPGRLKALRRSELHEPEKPGYNSISLSHDPAAKEDSRAGGKDEKNGGEPIMNPDNPISRLFEDVYGKSRRTRDEKLEAWVDV
jgi:hypothetical protein